MVPVKITASFSEKDAEAIARIASRTDRSMSSVMRLAVKRLIEDEQRRDRQAHRSGGRRKRPRHTSQDQSDTRDCTVGIERHT